MTPETEKYLLEPWTVKAAFADGPASLLDADGKQLAICNSPEIAEFLLLCHDVVAGIESGRLDVGRGGGRWWVRTLGDPTRHFNSFLSACRAALRPERKEVPETSQPQNG